MHTPGPWTYREDSTAGPSILAPDGKSVIRPLVWGSDMELGVKPADARLMAAAPLMLDVLAQLEWSVRAAPYRFCPACRAVEPDAEFTPEGDLKVGHWPDCYLAAALRAAKGEASPDGDLHDLGG